MSTINLCTRSDLPVSGTGRVEAENQTQMQRTHVFVFKIFQQHKVKTHVLDNDGLVLFLFRLNILRSLLILIRITTKNLMVSPCLLSTEFCENWLGSFYQTKKETNKQTNTDENVTFLVEVISYTIQQL